MNKRLLALLFLLVLATLVLAACGGNPPAQPSAPISAENAHGFLPTLGETSQQPTSEGLPQVVLIVQTTPTPDWVEEGLTLMEVETKDGEYTTTGIETISEKEEFSSLGWYIPVKNHGSCEALVDINLNVWVDISKCAEEK